MSRRGELLVEVDLKTGPKKLVDGDDQFSLAKNNISKDESSRYQRLARIPDDQFELAIETVLNAPCCRRGPGAPHAPAVARRGSPRPACRRGSHARRCPRVDGTARRCTPTRPRRSARSVRTPWIDQYPPLQPE